MRTSVQETGALRQELLQTNFQLRRLTEESVEMKRMIYENDIFAKQQIATLYQQNQQQLAMLSQLVHEKKAVVITPQAVLPATPVSPTNAASPSGRMVVTLQAPSSLQGLTAKGVFVSWHSDGYHISIHNTDVNKSVRSSIKICVEYLTLFLTEHIEVLPATANCGAVAPIWRGRLVAKTNQAWLAAVAFADARGHKLSTSLSAFKAFMYEHTLDLPEGPATGDSAFQPPGNNKSLRSKAELIFDKQKNKNKRKAPPTSPQEEQEGNKRSKITTTGACATVGVTPPPSA